MQAAARRLLRWATAGAVTSALLAGMAGGAQAHERWKHRWWHGRYWAPYVGVAPFFAPPPVYYAPPPRAVYVPPPVVSYPEPTYVPYGPPGLSFNFTVPMR
jgi:hypothetical protein